MKTEIIEAAIIFYDANKINPENWLRMKFFERLFIQGCVKMSKLNLKHGEQKQ